MAEDPITQVSVPQGWIDFGIGQPDVNGLPLKQLAAAATHLFEQANRSILQYGMQQGNGNFRATLARFLSTQYDAAVDPEHLFITAGISQALDLICSLHTQPGDTVIVEEPSYFLALRIFSDYKLNIIGTPIDQNGLIIEALEEKLEKHRPIFVYTIPAFHNPSGVTLSTHRREKLTRLSETYGFFIVADEVYQMLSFGAAPPQPLTYYDPSERVLSLGSFSKILAPGLRLGWMQAKPSLLEPFIECGLLDSGGGLNPFVSSLVNSLLELGLQQDYLDLLKSTYHKRMAALSQALREHIPDLEFTDPDGGYFIWAHLADGVNTEALLARAKKYRVGFQPGIKFSSANGLRNYLRLCFAYYPEKDLVAGVERLAPMVR